MRITRQIKTCPLLLWYGLGLFSACGQAPQLPAPPEVRADSSQDPEIMGALQMALNNLLAAPGDLGLRMEYALLLDANGQDKSAQIAWQQLTGMEPGAARSWYYLSKVSERNADPDISLQAVQRCVELAPDYAPAQARLGRLLMECGELQLSEAAYRLAMQLDGSSPRGPLGLARLKLARGEGSDVIALLMPLLARNPREPFANALLARAYVLEGDRKQAEIHLAAEEKAGAASGGDPWGAELRRRATGKFTRISRAKSAMARGDMQAALAQMESLWERRNGEQAVLETLCEIRMLMGQPKQVIELLEETQAGFEQSYSLLLFRARAERALGSEERSLEAAQRAARLNPRRGEAAAFSGQILFALERYSEAVDSLVRARENGDMSLQSLVFLGRARALAGNVKAGLGELELAIEQAPLVPKPWAYRAELLAMAGRHAEAADSLSRATSLGLGSLTLERISTRLTQLKSKVH